MNRGHNTKTLTGFTIIEIMIFLAITGLLVVGVLVGTGSTIARQRYNDAVESFAEFLRRQYSFVINPQIQSHLFASSCDSDFNAEDMFEKRQGGSYYFNPDYLLSLYEQNSETGKYEYKGPQATGTPAQRGRSRCVLYGVMITFEDNGKTAIRTPLVGRDFSKIKEEYEALNPGMSIENMPERPNVPRDIELLALANIGGGAIYVGLTGTIPTYEYILAANYNSGNFVDSQTMCVVGAVGPPGSDSFSFRYSAEARGVDIAGTDRVPLPGTIFIIRSPINGTVKTYYSTNFKYSLSLSGLDKNGDDRPFTDIDDFNDNNGINLNTGGGNNSGKCRGQLSSAKTVIDLANNFNVSTKLNDSTFSSGEIPICVMTQDAFTYGRGVRRTVTIAANGRNPTAVSVVNLDGTDQRCID